MQSTPATLLTRLSLAATFALTVALTPAVAHATWSVVAVDRATGRIVISSATCVPQAAFARFPAKGLMDVQAILVPGIGIAAAQAGVDRTRSNQMLIYSELRKGTHPSAILAMLAADTALQTRQFGMVDLQGRFAGFSGASNGVYALSVQGQVPGTQVFYSIQGNILASNNVVQHAVRAFEGTSGSIEDRVMAAMEAADAEGGDKRCTCQTAPIAKTALPCTTKTAHVAYLTAADSTDVSGSSFNDGKYSVYLDVTDENTTPNEDPDPVKTLRMRFDKWKEERRK